MEKSQLISIGVFGLLFAVLYFGCETKSPESKAIETSRAINFETISIPQVRTSRLDSLDDPERQELNYLEQNTRHAETDSAKLQGYEQLSSFWYTNGSPILAGHYAKQVADSRQTVDSWAIAGSTYFICAKAETDDEIKKYCLNNAIKSLETAVSMDPDDVDLKINLALCYVDFPPEDNPMTGIQQLLSLQKANPTNSAIQLQLARLGLQTGQWDKAISRLQDVLSREPNNKKACCYIASAYTEKGETAQAGKYLECCEQK